MNPQFGDLNDVAAWLNSMPEEIGNSDIKGVLINLCQRVRAMELQRLHERLHAATSDNP